MRGLCVCMRLLRVCYASAMRVDTGGYGWIRVDALDAGGREWTWVDAGGRGWTQVDAGWMRVVPVDRGGCGDVVCGNVNVVIWGCTLINIITFFLLFRCFNLELLQGVYKFGSAVKVNKTTISKRNMEERFGW